MRKLRKVFQGTSIRNKLTYSFILASALVFVINIFMYYNLRQTLSQIDNVYNSNIELNKLSESLDKVQDTLYQYLSTKSSDSLEKYYSYEYDYRKLLDGLNQEIIDSDTALMEKNIYNISLTYIEKSEMTVQAKRGRDISGYKKNYAESERLYEFLSNSLDSLNTTIFLQNSSNYSDLRTTLNYLVLISTAMLILVMCIAVAAIVLITRSVTRPLIELAGVANEIAQGNMEVKFPIVETGDEITVVAKACNKMIDSIRNYIDKTKENYKRETQMVENELIMKNDLKEAQLKYLQAQINPHFLFNTLNAGAQLAMMEGAEKTCLFIENMADFFRYNVRKMGKDTTLGDEIKLVDNYIYILNVRFAGDIHFIKMIDGRCLTVRIPSMVLQPIVENAVNHGIRGMEGDGEIKLTIYGDENRICISIADNGAGVPDEIIRKLMEVKKEETVQDAAQQLRTAGEAEMGVGLHNVISRLRRYYNCEEVFSIRNREDGPGTIVNIYIPVSE